MRRVKVKLTERVPGKKSETKRMIKEGFIPVEIYGKDVENVHAWIGVKDFLSLPHGEAFLMEAEINGDKRVCILKEVQFGWLGDNPIHVDLYDIANVKEIEVEVPIEFVGTPAGVEFGGIFEALMHSLTVKARPANLPDKISIDVSGLGIGDVIHVRDIQPPEGCEILDNPEETVAVVAEPEIEQVVTEETEEETEEQASE
ncbi:large subunit ribosomal protein L25 [Hydrogenivirga caldilitoris]|uniref:Large ribosomal subunit protein bL25 n=1 Tax=Hydrogenivirga caldilitoris TaxID=246264 RepID=A0A497XLN8_9AQUI|nr:50S ribosomal protein L25/general stress protein Ctc [Hydrogenivirga caldilitoris]RLJ69787.1 large subunit ribosomal protein L25 [Hydrogenivirga caldilitoris]